MGLPRYLLPASLILLMIDAIIELSFISSMVAWLHRRAGSYFLIYDVDPSLHSDPSTADTFSLHGKPEYLLVDQGHTSNGAAGTAFVLVGFGGILALALRHRMEKQGRSSSAVNGLYYAWVISAILSTLLSLAALIATFILTNNHMNQEINVTFAANLNNQPYPNMVPYPLLEWTPENWFSAVLALDLVSASDRSDIIHHLQVMKGWRWNLIPLFLLGAWLCVVAVLDMKRGRAYKGVANSEKEVERV